MGGRNKQEFEPLLALGFHSMTLLEIRQLCVEAEEFTLSQRRKKIMDNLSMIIDRLSSVGIVGEAWIDGSFLTRKIDPCDVDFVLHMEAELYENGTSEQREAINWIISSLKNEYWCDTYPLFIYKQTDPLYSEYDWNRSFYQARFGWSEGMETKGIVVLALPGGG